MIPFRLAQVDLKKARFNEIAVLSILSGTHICPEYLGSVVADDAAHGVSGVEARHIAIAMSYTGVSLYKYAIGKSIRCRLMLAKGVAQRFSHAQNRAPRREGLLFLLQC